jgi:hypothetical protein
MSDYDRFMIGYDVRPRENRAVPMLTLPSATTITDLYTVDDVLWPSVWNGEWRDRPRPAWFGTVQHLWEDLQQLREEIQGHELQAPALWIGVEVIVPETDTMRSDWRGRAEPVRPEAPGEDWTLVGYDVADYYLRSWMRVLGEDKAWRARLRVPAESINQCGLFPAERLSDALEFVSHMNEIDTMTMGWCAFAIWNLSAPWMQRHAPRNR